MRQLKFGTNNMQFLRPQLGDTQEFKNTDQDVQTKFEVVTAVLIKISVLYNMPACRLVYRARCF
jgi:hypothetical protein